MILERWSCNRKTKRWSACLRTELIFSLTPLYAFWRVGGTTTFLYCGMCQPRLRIAFQMFLKPLAQLIALHFPARTSKNQIYDHTRKNFVSVQHKEISFCNTLGTCWDAYPAPLPDTWAHCLLMLCKHNKDVFPDSLSWRCFSSLRSKVITLWVPRWVSFSV